MASLSDVYSPLLKALLFFIGAPEPLAPPCMRQRLRPDTAGDWQSVPARVRAPHLGLSIMGRTLRACRLATPSLISVTPPVARCLPRGQALGLPDRRAATGVKQPQAWPPRLPQLVLRLPQLSA